MAESTLALYIDDLRNEVGHHLGFGRTYSSMTADQKADVDAVLPPGLRQFYQAHYWSFLEPTTSLVTWESLLEDTAVDAAVFVSSVGSTVTATADSFDSDQVGMYISITGVDAFPITAVTSARVCTVTGTPGAAGETFSIGTMASNAAPVTTTLTSKAAAFYPTMIGKTLTFARSGTEYEITGYTSSTVVTLDADASGEEATDLILITADGDYRLPDDYGGITGELTFAEDEGWRPITVIGEGKIRALRQRSTSAGTPRFAAIRPLADTGLATRGQRFDIQFHPKADDAYTISYKYKILPSKLVDTTNEYPYGGMAHSETVLESCLAIAEQRLDDTAGLHTAKYEKLLAKSIAQDLRDHTPEHLGYNADRSERRRPGEWRRSVVVTVNGVEY